MLRQHPPYRLVTILGPTACGKTAAAVAVARRFYGEILSADSRQVYRGLDIGTGKDLHEYTSGGDPVTAHLIDLVNPAEEYNVFRFQQDFYAAYADVCSRGKLPVLCGGTGMYLSSVIQQYRLAPVDFSGERYSALLQLPEEELQGLLLSVKPRMHSTTDLQNKERMAKAVLIAEARAELPEHPKLQPVVLGIFPPREEVRRRITDRLKARFSAGLIEEVERLLQQGVTRAKMEFFGLEYRFVSRYLAGELTRDELFTALNSAIHDFAKRQMSWFRKMEREGVEIRHCPSADPAVIFEQLNSVLP